MVVKETTPDIIFIPTKLSGGLKSEWQELPSSPYDEIYVKRGKIEQEIIDKFEDFMSEHFDEYISTSGLAIFGADISFDVLRFIEDFKKYMEESV